MANISYYAVIPLSVIVESQQALAADFFRLTLGPWAQNFTPILIALSALGAVSCMTFSAARVIHSASRDNMFIPGLAQTSRFHTPMRALLLHYVLSLLYIIAVPSAKAYAFLVNMVGYSQWLYYFLTVMGLLWLRQKMPDIARPFKIWWPLAVIFCIFAVVQESASFVPPVHSQRGWWWPAGTAVLGFALSVLAWLVKISV